jgi:HSP20 family molecular chaperone IbpA
MSEFNRNFIDPASQPQGEELLRQQKEWINRAYDFAVQSVTRPEVRETLAAWEIAVELPDGAKPTDVDVSFEKDSSMLTVSADRDNNSKFRKSFRLEEMIMTESADLERITAKFDNGVLLIAIPKVTETTDDNKSIKIPIN